MYFNIFLKVSLFIFLLGKILFAHDEFNFWNGSSWQIVHDPSYATHWSDY